MVCKDGRENDIDKSFYQKLADDAIEEISKYGDYDWFVSDESASFIYEDKFEADETPLFT